MIFDSVWKLGDVDWSEKSTGKYILIPHNGASYVSGLNVSESVQNEVHSDWGKCICIFIGMSC
jgi:hypothetical protein